MQFYKVGLREASLRNDEVKKAGRESQGGLEGTVFQAEGIAVQRP